MTMKIYSQILTMAALLWMGLALQTFRQSAKFHCRLHQLCFVDVNFVDQEVLCSSEGGTWNMPQSTTDDPMIGMSRNFQDMKYGNFADIEVECNSEGGRWNVAMSSFPSTVSKKVTSYQERSLSWLASIQLLFEMFSLSSDATTLVNLCDRIDASKYNSREKLLLKLGRQNILATLLRRNRNDYIETVKFLSNRIPRSELPNVQDIPIAKTSSTVALGDLIADCELQNVTYFDSPLDKLLLSIFRDMVQKEVNFQSSTPGIAGLLEEGRHYMLSERGTSENQHAFVRRVLGGLLTPFLPPFYRIFMAGIVPSSQAGDPQWLIDVTSWLTDKLPTDIKNKVQPGTQYGPWFYAPVLTSVVTPPFLSFLVGPSRINRRKDGQFGGMVVEKCKFLQESGCKGLCLHQCKLPAQQFFTETLGVPLTVSPNFATQECQWSWGEVPLPPAEDPSFPSGCLQGCPTRSELKKWQAGIEVDGAGSQGGPALAAGANLCNM